MAIRTYCDHCGLEVVRNPHYFLFGPADACLDINGDCRLLHQEIPNPVAKMKPVRLELCTHCAPIWMRRVQSLTNDSTPEKPKVKSVKKTDV